MTDQWSPERANEWFASIPLPFGCNFLPSTAVNSTEMWQADTFDPATIERELQLAAGLGYNTVRVFLQFMVWEADPAGHNERLETFLRLADGAGITMMPILFDDCRFDDRDPYPGRQDDPKPGVHNSRWTPSPGYATADDPARWPQLEAYVGDVVGAFGADRRVLVWDLYNEPGGDRPKKSLPLVEAAFRWARAADPRQPLTVGSFFWHDYMTEIRLCGERNSDVVSFHCYGNLHEMRERLDELAGGMAARSWARSGWRATTARSSPATCRCSGSVTSASTSGAWWPGARRPTCTGTPATVRSRTASRACGCTT